MKQIRQRFSDLVTNRHNLQNVVRDAVLFGFNQGGVQLISIFSGFMVIWILPKDDYARLTIALAGLTMLTVLSDAGIGTAVKSLGQRVGSEPVSPKLLLKSALKTRRRLFLLAAPLASAYVVVLLLKNGASYLEAFALSGAVIAAALPTLRYQIVKIILLVRHSTANIKRVEVAGSVARLLMYGVALLIAPSSLAIVLTTAAVSLWQARSLRIGEVRSAEVSPPDPVDLDWRMRSIVRRLLPNSLFFCVQGQIGYVFLSFWSETSAVADAGALARLAVVYAILTTPFTSVIALRVTADVSGSLVRSYGAVLISALCVAIVPLTLVLNWPRAFLLPLGPAYMHLTSEAILVGGVGVISMFAATILTLNEVRGWVRLYSLYYIPVTAGFMAMIAVTLNPAQVSTAIILSGAAPFAVALLGSADALLGFRKIARTRA